MPEGNESNKTTETDPQSVSLIINNENLFKINDASINILKLITYNDLNQYKQTRNQHQQNLNQPNIVYDQSNNEKIRFLPKLSAKRLNDQHHSEPSAKRQKKQFILPQNQNIDNNQKQI